MRRWRSFVPRRQPWGRTMDDIEEIRWRKAAIDDAKEMLSAFVEQRWPVGSPVTWLRAGGLQYGEVLNLHGERLKVRNTYSGSAYWITLYDIEMALKAIAATRSHKGNAE